MQFCPEVAVFFSAFQLLRRKVEAQESLSDASKTCCLTHIHILRTAVEEICAGLQEDADPDIRLLWQQRLHALVLYSLVRKKYRTNHTSPAGIVIQMDSLHSLSTSLPAFSAHLYLVLLKQCSWTHLFLQSLHCLDYTTSSALFEAALDHVESDPVTQDDADFVAIVTEHLLSQCFCIPAPISDVTKQLLGPLCEPVKTKIVIFPESNTEQDLQTRNRRDSESDTEQDLQASNIRVPESNTEQDSQASNRRDTKDGGSSAVTGCYSSVSCVAEPNAVKMDARMPAGVEFWMKFLQENTHLSRKITTFLENALSSYEESGKHCVQDGIIPTALLGQLSMLFYLTDVVFQRQENEKWLINNLYPLKQDEEHFQTPGNETSACYCLNYPLIEALRVRMGDNNFKAYLQKMLNIMELSYSEATSIDITKERKEVDKFDESVENCFIDEGLISITTNTKKPENEESTENCALRTFNQSLQEFDFVMMLSGLVISKCVLLRMLQACLSVEVGGATCEMNQDEHSPEMGLMKPHEASCEMDENQSMKIDKPDKSDEASCKYISLKVEGLVESVGPGAVCHCTCGTDPLHAVGADWTQDVTLAALLWRIEHRLAHYEVCIDFLLCEQCPPTYWQSARLHTVLKNQLPLLQRQSRVMSLWKKQEGMMLPEEGKQLLMCAFNGLLPLEKDGLITTLYEQGGLSGEIEKPELGVQVTQVFNKITADLDSQVKEELYMLYFTHPASVLHRAIVTAVENREQATNMSQVCGLVPSLCQSLPPTHLAGTLLCVTLQTFLDGQSLSHKQQKHFTLFVKSLMTKSQSTKSQHKSSILNPVEFLHLVVLPSISIQQNGPIGIKFGLNLLLACLEAGCNKVSDWSKFNPVTLVFLLLECVHESLAVWEEKNAVVTMETRSDRLVVREMCLQAMESIVRMIDSRCIQTPDDTSLSWLLYMTEPLHWSVRLYLCPLLDLCGHSQVASDLIQSTFDLVKVAMDTSLVPVLQFVSLGLGYRDIVEMGTSREAIFNYRDIAVALVQLFPHLLLVECLRVVEYLERLLLTDQIDLVYRLQAYHNLPCLGYRDAQPCLCVSQLLTDVMTMLINVAPGCDLDLLQHSLHLYVAVIKEKSCGFQKTVAMRMFVLAEVFHHVCSVAVSLPSNCVDTVLVLLLNVVNRFKDVAMETVARHSERVDETKDGNDGSGVESSDMYGIEDLRVQMLKHVDRLPATCEETQMIKKLLN